MKPMLVVALAFAVGCSHPSGSTAPSAPPVASNASSPAGSANASTDGIEYAALISKSAGKLTVDRSGQVVLNDKLIGTITQAGELTSASGAFLASVDADGNLTIKGWGPGLQLVVRADGSVLDHGNVAIVSAADGTLSGHMPDEPALAPGELQLVGDKDGFRAVMVAWIGGMLTGAFRK